MKKKLGVFLFLLILFIGFLAIRFFVMDKQNSNGQLKVLVSPSASVFMDNVAVGKTPFEDKFKVGEYLLKLIPEGNATDTASWQSKIKIYKNTRTYVNMELGSSDISTSGEVFTSVKMTTPVKSGYGEVMVETEPQGAIVYLDNDEKGVAPVKLENVLKGDHEISVFMPGFFRRTQKINIDPGYQVNAKFKLAIDQSQTPKVEEKKTATDEASLKEASVDIKTGKQVTIKETPTGWLRVREEPNAEASESAKVNPGDKFDILGEEAGWIKIEYEKNKTGWISGQYVDR
ncbi:hypothetical protein AUK04_03640 [Candidatus Roizmanbacteria bacterium CG2_30_33_16]|uniref:SH3b domain-containing protein n=2 Tax=Candidatus Roizmaniibacteriota TaxID=1752723 RepID=A0A1J5HF34_9BACT|nr:MAG: hypothetical protein AUK04_03640 [Candidatus Roizmanbacteria bacterium CG2_30_33_16]